MPEEKFETPKILSDLPLIQGETASFHFDKFAITLARLIAYKKTRTPLTIGVSGTWGSGKTTLLRRIKTMLDATPNMQGGTMPDKLEFVAKDEFAADEFRVCRTVWFDVWKYAGEDQILAALLRVIVEEMRRDGFWKKIKAEVVAPKTEELKGLDLFINALTTFVSAGTYQLNLADFKVDTPLKEASAFFDYFDDSFKRLLAAWVGGKSAGGKEIKEEEGVLVVFIDDLDRCLPKKIIEVLEAVKLFLDKTGCVFVLGAHTDIIRQAVKKHYIEEGLQEQDAADYLDKFIQLRFDLPPAPEDEMQAYVRQLAVDGSLAEHWRLVTIGAGYNPRKVKGFLNDLSLRWAIWKNVWQAGQVEYEDFVRWEVWMGAAPKFRLRVYQVYDKDDLSILNNLVDAAFRWAGGEEEARAGFKDDVTDSMRRVLREIQPFKARFTSEVLDCLLHLTVPPQKPEIKTEMPEVVQRIISELEEVVSVERDVIPLQDVTPREALRGESKTVEREAIPLRQDAIPPYERKRTPGGIEIFTFGGLEFVKVPAGKFLMGSKEDNKLARDSEKPQHTLELPEYYIARFPVTNRQYAEFVGKDFKIPPGKEEHPVVEISWRDAQGFIAALNEKFVGELPQKFHFRMPSEAQWEKAARGEFGNEWPWGNEFVLTNCNSLEGGNKDTMPVYAYSPQGDSPYGAADMVGNVWEWTHTLLKEYPYKADDGRESEEDSERRVVRGGSWDDDRHRARCACRSGYIPDYFLNDLGFRPVLSPI